MNRTTPLDDWPNPPSLQKLIEECGGYNKISPERWAEFDAAMEMWKARFRAGELHRIELTDTGRTPTTKAERAS